MGSAAKDYYRPDPPRDILTGRFLKFVSPLAASAAIAVGGKPLGASMRLKNQEVRWLLAVLAGEPLDQEEVLAYVRRRIEESGDNQARMHRLAPNNRRRRNEREQEQDGDTDEGR